MEWAGRRWRDGGEGACGAGWCRHRDGLGGDGGWCRWWEGGGGASVAFGSVAPSVGGEFSFCKCGGRFLEIGVAGCGFKNGDVECGVWEDVCDMRGRGSSKGVPAGVVGVKLHEGGEHAGRACGRGG